MSMNESTMMMASKSLRRLRQKANEAACRCRLRTSAAKSGGQCKAAEIGSSLADINV